MLGLLRLLNCLSEPYHLKRRAPDAEAEQVQTKLLGVYSNAMNQMKNWHALASTHSSGELANAYCDGWSNWDYGRIWVIGFKPVQPKFKHDVGHYWFWAKWHATVTWQHSFELAGLRAPRKTVHTRMPTTVQFRELSEFCKHRCDSGPQPSDESGTTGPDVIVNSPRAGRGHAEAATSPTSKSDVDHRDLQEKLEALKV